MDGYLLLDKPAGWTSHDAVAKIRGIIRAETGQKVKIGHTGTLDPMATGLLVLVLGAYTKKAAELSKLDKTYEAELTLGATSSTADAEGEITPKNDYQPTEDEIREVLKAFIGRISQVPPAYSAVKVGGQRAYKAARAGRPLQIEPRLVTIYSIDDIHYEYPRLSFTASVSSGTYIRSMAEDIGEKLGTGAYLSGLRRTSVGRFKLQDALQLENLDADALKTGVANL